MLLLTSDDVTILVIRRSFPSKGEEDLAAKPKHFDECDDTETIEQGYYFDWSNVGIYYD